MRFIHVRDMVVNAVNGQDANSRDTLDAIVDVLCECEAAKQILRAKGYGVSGMTIDATARLVPDLK